MSKIKLGGGYILQKNGKVKYEKDILKWANWFEKARLDKKSGFRVGFTKTKNYHISTVFLALDYSFGGKKPILWETMVFENKLSTQPPMKIGAHQTKAFKYHKSVDAFGLFERYSTRKEAEAGHKKIVGMVKLLEKKWSKKYGKANSSKAKSTSGSKRQKRTNSSGGVQRKQR